MKIVYGGRCIPPSLFIMKEQEENQVEISSELLNEDIDNIQYNQEEFDDSGIDEGFAQQIGF